MTREGMAVPNTTLCEKLVSDDNLTRAAKEVPTNLNGSIWKVLSIPYYTGLN